MEKRIVLFIVLSIAVFAGNLYLQRLLQKNQPAPVAVKNEDDKSKEDKDKVVPAKNDKGKDTEKADPKKGDGKDNEAKPGDPAPPAEVPAENADPAAPAAEAPATPPVPNQHFALGSFDPNSPYRMLVTLTNRGAALERVEFNSNRFLELEDRSGYLGSLAPADNPQGCLVQVVGAGTPAAVAGLQAGDIITAIDEDQITNAAGLIDTLRKTKPNQQVQVSIVRGTATEKLSATLARVPAQIIRPEKDTVPLQVLQPGNHDPLSLLLTLQSIDGKKIGKDEKELAGVDLYTANWEGKQVDEQTVEFSRVLAAEKLRIIKRYRLAKTTDDTPVAWHLNVEIELQNTGEEARNVAYLLNGPNGLPIEGWWYLHRNRISRSWGSLGVRDVALRMDSSASNTGESVLISSLTIADGTVDPLYREETDDLRLLYAGVDSQYFASVLLPDGEKTTPWLAEIRAEQVGQVPSDANRKKLVNVSCELMSNTLKLEPNGPGVKHSYQLFVGPKRREVLAAYGRDGNTLEELIYFGWPIWGAVAKVMLTVLHFFYSIVGNYGIAIIMLTVSVRLLMFPLSRKQALSAQKMQELQPEMKRINDKYKGKNEDRARAMQELWRKHNYNPMGGCLLAFVQLPIFLGLYRSLMIDVELRGSPLFGESVRWCSNLAAPDMLFRWDGFVPHFLSSETGWLGPYFNLLPLITTGLFLVQQKMFMPPPTDEQSAMQQKMMKYMMAVMAVMFYTVASGLCLYFIASSLWGIGERKLLPKMIGSSKTKPTPVAAK
ncbi:MAG: YidC/Oxa1 family insertase periplasmic-domain containing protein [Planctomycetota bacterium]|nr:YidC/Oxa1 family insertase periplasmic-domain containing protein [Planctomycetota bacterium]